MGERVDEQDRPGNSTSATLPSDVEMLLNLAYGAERKNVQDDFTTPQDTIKSDWVWHGARDDWLDNICLPSIEKSSKQTAFITACHHGPKDTVTEFNFFQTVWKSNADIEMDKCHLLTVQMAYNLIQQLYISSVILIGRQRFSQIRHTIKNNGSRSSCTHNLRWMRPQTNTQRQQNP